MQCIQGLPKDQPVVEGKHSALWTWKLKTVWIPVSNILYYFWASIYCLGYFPFVYIFCWVLFLIHSLCCFQKAMPKEMQFVYFVSRFLFSQRLKKWTGDCWRKCHTKRIIFLVLNVVANWLFLFSGVKIDQTPYSKNTVFKSLDGLSSSWIFFFLILQSWTYRNPHCEWRVTVLQAKRRDFLPNTKVASQM